MTIEFNIPDELQQKILAAHGDKGCTWLSKLPELISKYQKLWDITLIEFVSDLSYNFVAHAKFNHNSARVIFKAVVPGQYYKSELQAMEFFAGAGCVELLNYVIEDGVMLLEEAQPGTTLAEYTRSGRDEEATVICAELIKSLHAKKFTQHSLKSPPQNLHDLFSEFEDIKPLVYKTGSVFELKVLLRAQHEYADLLKSTKTNILLHGDLHHFNILKSKTKNWLAIDPHGIVGDPVFEIAAFMRNPYPGVLKIGDTKKLLQRRIDIFADYLGFDKQRIWRWSFAHNILAAGWMFQDQLGDWQEIYQLCLILLEMPEYQRMS